MNAKLIKYEEITDSIEHEIAAYIGEVAKGELSIDAQLRVKGTYRIIKEMESLGDSGEAIGRILKRCRERDCKFSKQMLQRLNNMVDTVDKAYEAMHANLALPVHTIKNIDNAYEAESLINRTRDTLREEHLNNLENPKYNYDTGIFYMDVVSELEKMGDFIINVSEALIDEQGE